MTFVEEFEQWYGKRANTLRGYIGITDGDVISDLKEIMRVVKDPEHATELGDLIEAVNTDRDHWEFAILGIYAGVGQTWEDKAKQVVRKMAEFPKRSFWKLGYVIQQYRHFRGGILVLNKAAEAETDKDIEALINPKMFECVKMWRDSPYVHKLIAGLLKQRSGDLDSAKDFFDKYQDHNNIERAIDALNQGNVNSRDLLLSLTPYGKYIKQKGMQNFIEQIYKHVPAEIRDELNLQEVVAVIQAYDALSSVSPPDRGLWSTSPALRSAVENCFFESMQEKVGQGKDKREKKKILYEWSVNVCSMIRSHPERLLYEVFV